ncbi:MAG: type II secretion system minor pseudopilin GspH [Woeseiaceae bacterium]
MIPSNVSAAARPSYGSGFTLIEVLVVVTIIGIISAVVVLSLGNLGDDRELQTEARRITSLIEMASDEATLQGRDFGLEFLQTGYRFVEYDALTGQWSEVFGDELMRLRQLAQDTEFDLFLEDRRILLDIDAADSAQNDDADDNYLRQDFLPHILILSSGDITPFRLEIVRNTDRSSVSLGVSANGEISVGTSDD